MCLPEIFHLEALQAHINIIACRNPSSTCKEFAGIFLQCLQLSAYRPEQLCIHPILQPLKVHRQAVHRVAAHGPLCPGLLYILGRVCIAPHKHSHENLQQQAIAKVPTPFLACTNTLWDAQAVAPSCKPLEACRAHV